MPAFASTITTTVLVVVVYFWVVRLIDMNEKEPLWAMALLFALGSGAAVVLPWLAPADVLALSVVPAAALKELARFLAIGAGIYAITVYGRIRGWQEFNGTMDGIVYGACAGLGFAVATELRAELIFGAVPLPGASVGLLAGFVRIALFGMADGVLGALIGAGIGASTDARSPVARALFPVAAVAAAVAAHVGFVTLAHGDALGGTAGLVRSYAAMALPVIALAIVIIVALRAERAAIRRQLPAEADTGVVTPDDLALLLDGVARTKAYWQELVRGRLTRWANLRELHNRQVQLALIKDKAARLALPSSPPDLDRDVERLRHNVLECKRRLATGPSKKGEA